MKFFFLTFVLALPFISYGQGSFLPNNPTAPTYIGSANGPLAGPEYWGQFLVGTNIGSLTPVGNPLQHGPSGRVSGNIVTIPGIPGDTFAYIQLVAWNGTLWGTTLSGVPEDQLGRTDIISHYFTYDFQPQFAPQFIQSAIVPIPEPSTWALVVLGAGALCFATRKRKLRVER